MQQVGKGLISFRFCHSRTDCTAIREPIALELRSAFLIVLIMLPLSKIKDEGLCLAVT